MSFVIVLMVVTKVGVSAVDNIPARAPTSHCEEQVQIQKESILHARSLPALWVPTISQFGTRESRTYQFIDATDLDDLFVSTPQTLPNLIIIIKSLIHS
jgi:hypothetical protein